MKRATLAFLLVSVAGAAVDGTVINRTTGEPQAGVAVTVFKLGQAGMSPVGVAKSDAGGKFRLEQAVEAPLLIQTTYDGVTYSQMVTQGASPTGLTVEVFDASPKPGAAKVIQHMVLFEPVDNQLFVTENVIFGNGGNVTYNDSASGAVRVHIPDAAAGNIRVMATAPNGVPVQRTAEKTSQAGVYKIDFPIKPGETRIDVSYAIPFTTPGSFTGRVLQRDAPVRLVTPEGVALSGEGIESLGHEPNSHASIYAVKGTEYKVEIQGAGKLRPAQEAAEEEAGPGIEQILPRVYGRVYWIVGLGLAILMLGLIVLYRGSPAAAAPNAPAHPVKGRRSR